MSEFLRDHQLNLMLVLSGMCGLCMIFVLISGLTTKRKKWLFLIETTAMLLLLADRYSYVFRGDESQIGYWMVRITNFMVFFLSLALIFCFDKYLIQMFINTSELKRGRIRFATVELVCIFGMILLVISQFTGFYYTFDSSNHYVRSKYFVISFLIPLIALFLLLSIIMQCYSLLQENMRFVLLLFTVVPFIATAIQIYTYGLSLSNIAMVGLVILLYIMDLLDLNRTAKKSYDDAQRLQQQLTSAADIYVSVHDIDVINDSFSSIVINNKSLTDVMGMDITNAQHVLTETSVRLSAPESREEIRSFVDYSTLEERLKGRKTITIELLTVYDVWIRGRFIASQYTPDGKLSHVLWLIENIDDEKRERDKLIDISERAVAANEAKTAFLSNMSHEIRTPINAMLGMNEMIQRESKNPDILNYSNNINIAGHTLLGLINDILDFSKIEAGKVDILPVKYYMASMLNDLVVMIQSRIAEKGLRLELDFDKDIPTELYGDEMRIKQSITNILTNAAKYTKKGSVKFHVGFEKIYAEPDYVYLNVSVKDTGIGIKKEDVKKLFTKFERIEERRNRNIEGTGLGMNITQNLLEMMDSKLEVDSVYGEGSNFYFRLKQRVLDWTPMGDYLTSYNKHCALDVKHNEKFIAPDAKVLVVDDNDMNLKVFAALVKRLRVNVEIALSGDAGLKLTNETKFDMIFLDHMMPDKDGIETLAELKTQKNNPNLTTPVVCLTANAISGIKEQYLKAGFDDYLSKPLDSGALERMMLEYLPEDKIIIEGGTEDNSEENDFVIRIPELADQKLIDVSTGIKNSGSIGDYKELLRMVHLSADAKIAELKKYLAEGDIENYTIKVHALKSSSRIIGALDLGNMAESLEHAGKRGDIDYIKKHADEFIDEFYKVSELLSGLEDEHHVDKGLPEADENLMETVYEEIALAADEMNCDQLEEIFREMDKYSIPEKDRDLFNKLKNASVNFMYDDILEMLKNR